MYVDYLRSRPHLCVIDVYNQAVRLIILPEIDGVPILPRLVLGLYGVEHSTMVYIFHDWAFRLQARCLFLGQEHSRWTLRAAWETLPRQCCPQRDYRRNSTAAPGTSGVELEYEYEYQDTTRIFADAWFLVCLTHSPPTHLPGDC